MLTSYLYRGLELNDGLSYAVPSQGLTLDDRPTTEESFAYRGPETPISTGITVREGVVPFLINIIASSQAEFQSRLDGLVRLFHTQDPAYYRLERRLPHQQYYRYIEASPRQLTVDRINRQVTVTFSVRDRVWRETETKTATATLFAGASRDVQVEVPYAGLSPVEPVLKVKALSIGTDGPVPLYYRECSVWVVNPEQVVGTPIRLTQSWDTSALVTAGKMRADGADITVTLPDGTLLQRVVFGTQSDRAVWIRPQVWPNAPRIQVLSPPSRYFLLPAVNTTDTSIYLTASDRLDTFLKPADTIAIAGEYISYTGITMLGADGKTAILTGCTRGANGTTPGEYMQWQEVKFRTTVKVNYGYADGYKASQVFPNDLTNWPLINYNSSSNTIWVQDEATQAASILTGPIDRPLAWYGAWDPTQLKAGEYASASHSVLPDGRARLYGSTTPGYFGSGGKYRLACKLYPANSRQVGSIEPVHVIVKGGNGQFPTARVRLSKVIEKFGQFTYVWQGSNGFIQSQERISTITEFATASASADFGAGPLSVGQSTFGYTATHLTWSLVETPTDTTPEDVERVQLVHINFHMDSHTGRQVLTRFSTVEQGLGAGEFPVVMNVQNLDDPSTPMFQLYPRLTVGAEVIYDCETYEVTGEPLANCSYSNATWLRLLPGVNHLRFTGPAGVGQVQVTLTWKNRM